MCAVCVFSGVEKESVCVLFSGAEKEGVLCEFFFLEQKKRVKPCVVRISFSTVLLQQEKWRPYNLFLGYTFT